MRHDIIETHMDMGGETIGFDIELLVSCEDGARLGFPDGAVWVKRDGQWHKEIDQ